MNLNVYEAKETKRVIKEVLTLNQTKYSDDFFLVTHFEIWFTQFVCSESFAEKTLSKNLKTEKRIQ